ncbi:hypothetical protein [Pyxidicoccus sp. MSG2]|uniref:hypothetical protein n=1 Tax=Pyxidicoccus sp. MSG2 TaxID=2996790 RepID=UPI002271545F|nr:hypothetical protein [Pyxidicoccus sp. MSG2]MCY1019669.1 hypothetical protein [Pyxidicoccus sp. MSG2]MCY1022044.1 hypothetical protein [Pyxidicoccus sp. MSG2]MCY1022340.1 hypothetical protein [Pyxidicoccus sp. MSG2]
MARAALPGAGCPSTSGCRCRKAKAKGPGSPSAQCVSAFQKVKKASRKLTPSAPCLQKKAQSTSRQKVSSWKLRTVWAKCCLLP